MTWLCICSNVSGLTTSSRSCTAAVAVSEGTAVGALPSCCTLAASFAVAAASDASVPVLPLVLVVRVSGVVLSALVALHISGFEGLPPAVRTMATDEKSPVLYSLLHVRAVSSSAEQMFLFPLRSCRRLHDIKGVSIHAVSVLDGNQ